MNPKTPITSSEPIDINTSNSGNQSQQNAHSRSVSVSSVNSSFLSGSSVTSNKPPVVKEVIKDSWTIRSTRSSISSASHYDLLSHELGFPLPTMFFGSNNVILEFFDSSAVEEIKSPIFQLYFDAMEAIKTVSKTSDSEHRLPVKIAASNEEFWRKKSLSEPIFDYDWTYTPMGYSGTFVGKYNINEVTEEEFGIDYGRLRQPDTILFFDENTLYEDELGDNGIAAVTVKLRVMEYGFYVLTTFFLRVDQVVFRSLETRYYHEFDKSYVIREFRYKEDSFDNVMLKLAGGASFRDNEAVMQALPIVEKRIEKIDLS